jgi:GR25 family glycosyltransferase involved in LPS biosynthesis
MFPLFYINLDRRADRNDSVLSQLESQRFTKDAIFRYAAKDAKLYTFTQPEIDFFKYADFNRLEPPHVVNAIMCNFLSHYDLWSLMVKYNYPYLLIAQDDIVFSKNLESVLPTILTNLPSDTEVVWLAIPEVVKANVLDNHRTDYYEESVSPMVAKLHPRINPCSLFYLITQKGARNLIEYSNQNGVGRATDHFMNDYLRSKGIQYVSKKLLASNSDIFGSDIFDKE